MQTKPTTDETRRSSARLAIAEAVDTCDAVAAGEPRDSVSAMRRAVARLDRAGGSR